MKDKLQGVFILDKYHEENCFVRKMTREKCPDPKYKDLKSCNSRRITMASVMQGNAVKITMLFVLNVNSIKHNLHDLKST